MRESCLNRQATNQGTCTVTSSKGSKPSISRALNQDVTSGGKLPGRRDRRALNQERCKRIGKPRIVEKGRSAKDEGTGDKREFEFFQIEIGIGFFFGLFPFSDVLAKFAGMLA